MYESIHFSLEPLCIYIFSPHFTEEEIKAQEGFAHMKSRESGGAILNLAAWL